MDLHETLSDLELSPKIERFCIHLSRTGKKGLAAHLAGFKGNSAPVTASRLCKRKDVQEAIRRLSWSPKERAKAVARSRSLMGPNDVLEVLSKISKLNVTPAFMENEKSWKHPSEWPDDVASAVKGIETKIVTYRDKDGNPQREATITKVHFVDKNQALKIMADHYRLIGIPIDPEAANLLGKAFAALLAEREGEAKDRDAIPAEFKVVQGALPTGEGQESGPGTVSDQRGEPEARLGTNSGQKDISNEDGDVLRPSGKPG